MTQIVEELVQRHELNVTTLADALGLPHYVVFKKVKMVDNAKAVLNFEKSPLMQLLSLIHISEPTRP